MELLKLKAYTFKILKDTDRLPSMEIRLIDILTSQTQCSVLLNFWIFARCKENGILVLLNLHCFC